MLFAVFYQTDLAGKLAPIMGSEGVCPLDGRYSQQRATRETLNQADRLRIVKPWIIGYGLRRGSYGNSSPWGGVHPLNAEKAAEFAAAKAKGVVPW